MRLISRRKVIQSGIATVAITALPDLMTPLWAEPLVTYPGIQLYTVDKELKVDAGGTLKSIQEIGYKEVEGAGFAGLTAKQFRADAGLSVS
jgi:hypothetical protein